MILLEFVLQLVLVLVLVLLLVLMLVLMLGPIRRQAPLTLGPSPLTST